MFGVGGGEILVIALVAVILFGTDDLPKNMQKFMKAWNNFRGMTNDLQRSWLDVRDQVTRDILTERPAQNAHQSGLEESSEAQSSETSLDSEQAKQDADAPSAEALGDNTVYQESHDVADLPSPRVAIGSLARGELEDSNTNEKNAVSSAADPDKST
jgi:Sec-independent protein translocase protein TatA